MRLFCGLYASYSICLREEHCFVFPYFQCLEHIDLRRIFVQYLTQLLIAMFVRYSFPYFSTECYP